jgi:hypothetical protein
LPPSGNRHPPLKAMGGTASWLYLPLDNAREAGARLLTPHRRRLLKRSSTYKNLVIDAAWRMRRPPAAPPALTSPLVVDRLARVMVRWPTTYLPGSLGLQPAGQSRMARRLSSLRFAMSRMAKDGGDRGHPAAV